LTERIRISEWDFVWQDTVHCGIFGTSVDSAEPLLVKENGVVRRTTIGEFVDSFCDAEQSGIMIPVKGVECLSLDLGDLKIKWKRVEAVYRHPAPERLIRLTLQTGRAITVTDDHSLFTIRNSRIEPIKTSELEIGDVVLIPKALPESASKFTPSISYTLQVPKGRLRDRWITRRIPIDNDLMRFLGYWVSEGSIRLDPIGGTYGLHFDFGPNDSQAIEEVSVASQKLFEIEGNIRQRLDSRGRRVYVHGKYPAFFIHDYCGLVGKAKNKKIPDLVFNAPANLQRQFLQALWAGDCGVTVSANLASDMLYLIPQCLGCSGTISLRSPEGNSPSINGRLLKRTLGVWHLRTPRPESGTPLERKKSLGPPTSEVICPLFELLPWGKNGSKILRLYKRMTKKIFTELMHGKRLLRYERLNAIRDRKWRTITELATIWKISINNCRDWLTLPRHLGDTGLVEQKRIWGTDKYQHRLFRVSLKAREILEAIELTRKILFSSDIEFASIQQIEVVSPTSKFVYDLSVPSDENFIAGFGGVICHNTGSGKSSIGEYLAETFFDAGEYLNRNSMPPGTASWLLAEFARQGLLERVERGRYRIPPETRDLIAKLEKAPN